MGQDVRRTRRRGERLETHILETAWLELEENGWARLTMERVASRAGTGKASLYSRWPSRAALIRAASIHAGATIRATPAEFSDSLEDDLVTVLRGCARAHHGPYGEALRGMVNDSQPVKGGDRYDSFAVMPIQAVVDVVDHAQSAGHLRPGDIPARVINLGLDLVTHQYLLSGAAPADDALRRIVVDIWLPLLQSRRTTPP